MPYRFAIVASEYNSVIMERLIEGAKRALKDHSQKVIRVPGSFEIPLAARRAAESAADGYTLHTAYKSTKENLAIVKKIAALQTAKEKAEKEFNSKIGALHDQLVKAELPKADES